MTSADGAKPEQSLQDGVRAWWKRVADDLRAGELMLTATPPLTGDAVRHAQQAAEHALRAFLSRHDVAFRRTHSIAEIGGACVTIDASLADVVRLASPLTEYA